MKTEIEIKLKISSSEIDKITNNIETNFNCKINNPFHQTTHQFFLDDFTKQSVFPRIRNEENGEITLTIKAKTKETSEFFKRIELETTIGNTKEVIEMMPFLGFPKRISWEKRRYSFINSPNAEIKFCLDETPMGWFLEIEGSEESIENAVSRLNLKKMEKINKPYLALWEEYKNKHSISEENMMFN